MYLVGCLIQSEIQRLLKQFYFPFFKDNILIIKEVGIENKKYHNELNICFKEKKGKVSNEKAYNTLTLIPRFLKNS